mmetsp:Transcript_158467/g.508332  ORF Transcript_158467/g.508332 Transcript_158467/m.508332 type:complete len:244 (-) Transcript_158467:2133-2864(-)
MSQTTKRAKRRSSKRTLGWMNVVTSCMAGPMQCCMKRSAWLSAKAPTISQQAIRSSTPSSSPSSSATASSSSAGLLLLAVLVHHRVVLVRRLLPLLRLIGVPQLQGGVQGAEGHLADVLHLLGVQDPWASLLQAGLDAVGCSLESLGVETLGLSNCAGGPDLLELGQDPLQEFLHKFGHHTDLVVATCTLAEKAPSLEGRVPDLFVHGKVEDQEQGLRGLGDKGRKVLAQLVHKGVDTADSIR